MRKEESARHAVPELLSPAGGLEQLRAAIRFGADAVYLAGPRWGMRARASNFEDDELARAVDYAHERGVAVHVTLNTLMYDNDIDELPSYLRLLDGLGVDAVIVADMGAILLARKHAPRVSIHVSTQASVTNANTALAYADLGASRIVLARELTLEQIAKLHRRVGERVELEAFAHGVNVQILGEFHAVFFHRREKVVELCIDGAVDFSSARLVFELTKIAF